MSKGSWRRPSQISEEEVRKRWEETFGSEQRKPWGAGETSVASSLDANTGDDDV